MRRANLWSPSYRFAITRRSTRWKCWTNRSRLQAADRIQSISMKRGVLLLLGACSFWLGAANAQSIPALLEQAVAAQKSGDPETAIRLYREALKQRPELGEIHSNVGAALVQEGHFSEAIQEYELAIRAKPGNPAII